MPMCGFNQEMLEGLEKFHKGLAEKLVEKDEEEDWDACLRF